MDNYYLIDKKNNSTRNSFFLQSNFFWVILLLKLSATLFAFYIYASFSPFRDADRYLSNMPPAWGLNLLSRTFFTDFVFSNLKMILASDIAVHLFISFVLSYVLWSIFKSVYPFLNKLFFGSCLILPHFLIWSGMVGKEALAICGFLLIVRACVDITIKGKTSIIPLMLGMFLAVLIRPHYCLAYIYLLIVSIITSRFRLRIMGYFSTLSSLTTLLFLLVFISLLLIFFQDSYADYLTKFMRITESYFLAFTQCNANRWDIDWVQPTDFFSNLWWGLPMSIIGPTFSEAIQRPVLFPVFMEGCFSLFLFCMSMFTIVRYAYRNQKYSSLIVWGLLPAVFLGLLTNYCFGIFNAGSAIRYKQSLAPLFYFYPLLLMAMIDIENYLRPKLTK